MLDIADMASRFWNDLIARPSGPFELRFALQPAMAALLAARDSIEDARRSRYFWTVWTDRSRGGSRLKEDMRAVARVLILAALMDILYQIIALHGLRPLETVVIALLLALVPYQILRGATDRIAKRLLDRKINPRAKDELDHR